MAPLLHMQTCLQTTLRTCLFNSSDTEENSTVYTCQYFATNLILLILFESEEDGFRDSFLSPPTSNYKKLNTPWILHLVNYVKHMGITAYSIFQGFSQEHVLPTETFRHKL